MFEVIKDTFEETLNIFQKFVAELHQLPLIDHLHDVRIGRDRLDGLPVNRVYVEEEFLQGTFFCFRPCKSSFQLKTERHVFDHILQVVLYLREDAGIEVSASDFSNVIENSLGVQGDNEFKGIFQDLVSGLDDAQVPRALYVGNL